MNKRTVALLKELEKTQTEFWNIAVETANFISMLIKIKKPAQVLEIGTSNGYSAIWIAEALKYNNCGHLTTIEFYEERQSVARGYFEQLELSEFITTLQGPAVDILIDLVDEPDFSPDIVFIDANKSLYLKFFQILAPKLKKGTIIFADNVLSHKEKVEPFVNTIKSDPDYQVEILNLPAGLLMALKIN